MVQYDFKGLFLGLISYPFHLDGGDLYRQVFKKLFEQHKNEYLGKFAVQEENLYIPAAYRLFGSNGLAILSLIDEFAFSSRIFNSNHVSLGKAADRYQYKCTALTGSSECLDDKILDLETLAKRTFLRSEKRYPFIGILRIKLDCWLLFGHGADTTRAVKKQVKKLTDDLATRLEKDLPSLETIVVDSYDCDELLVVSFADSFRKLDALFTAIRGIKAGDLKEDVRWENGEDSVIEHICVATHCSYGYDVDFFSQRKGKPSFLKWDKAADWNEKGTPRYCVLCLIESNPGHEASLDRELKKLPFLLPLSNPPQETVTGGSVFKIWIPLEQINHLHQAVRVRNDGIQGHIRRIKLVLERGPHEMKEDTPVIQKHSYLGDGPMISDRTKKRILTKLTQLGISKITRERTLALVDMLNDCGNNPLQWFYCELLKPAVENLEKNLEDFLNPEASKPLEELPEIEQYLNSEINALEAAIYNRVYNKMTPNAVLEYGGGIQQFLNAFEFAYRQLVMVFCPDSRMADRQFIIISGAVKEFSTRTHTELNINHLLYPQLFCLTPWKESSNYSLQVLNEGRIKSGKGTPKTRGKMNTFHVFRALLQSSKGMYELRQLVLSRIPLPRTNPVYRQFEYFLNPEFLSYALHDFIIYHFAFQRDFDLMWRVYWKTFLQTSSNYSRRGIVRREDFIHLMLRLMMVAFRERETNKNRFDQNLKILDKNASLPPDPLLTPMWMECFEDLRTISEITCNALEDYNFQELGEELVILCETRFINRRDPASFAPYLWQKIPKKAGARKGVSERFLNKRLGKIDKIQKKIVERTLSFSDFIDTGYPASPDHVICLFSAFLRAVDGIDVHPDTVSVHATPRKDTGDIQFKIIEKDKGGVISGVTADPIGGFLIPKPENRDKYFAYRAILYRTLWDLSYRSIAVESKEA